MTNTADYISNYEKVSALVNVERVHFYTGPVSDAMRAGVAEGYLTVWTSAEDEVGITLSPAGRDRLAGFRALLS